MDLDDLDSERKTDSFQWPTREEWVKDRRTLYADELDEIEVSKQASVYATAGEIAKTIANLKAFLSDCGRKMRDLKAQGYPHQQPNEPRSQWIARWLAMANEDQDRSSEESRALQDTRGAINRAIAELKADKLPWFRPETRSALEELEQRYEAARRASVEVRRAEKAKTPIDDAAWKEELQWRTEMEQYFKARGLKPYRRAAP